MRPAAHRALCTPSDHRPWMGLFLFKNRVDPVAISNPVPPGAAPTRAPLLMARLKTLEHPAASHLLPARPQAPRVFHMSLALPSLLLPCLWRVSSHHTQCHRPQSHPGFYPENTASHPPSDSWGDEPPSLSRHPSFMPSVLRGSTWALTGLTLTGRAHPCVSVTVLSTPRALP